MEIKMTKEEDQLTVAVEGRLDTLTSPDLEKQLKPELDSLKKLTFDFAGLDYISSAGLRVLLMAAQAMEDKGEMIVRNVNSDIMDIFEVTGFVDILKIE
ncbi:MAG: STAS domain-containing protein [Eubacterium sp.]|nr:STAS domain-containing protein [Eubacterium sp.]